MRKPFQFLISLALFASQVASASSVVIQFGGASSIITDANYQSQIGASQIIQWNGVNSAGGSFGASGTFSNVGAGSNLSSLGAENLIITSRSIGTTDPNPLTFASSSPNILGVMGGDDAKFDASLSESWTFDFNQEARLKQLVFSALGFDGETIELTLEGSSPISFNRTDSSMSPVTYGSTSNRYVYNFPNGGVLLSPGNDITIAATQGSWGLQGIVVEAPPIILGVILEVDLTTGALRIINQSGADIEGMELYQITSENSLNPNGWNSLQDQNLPGFPAGNGFGNGWEELGLANPDADFNLDGIVDDIDLLKWQSDFGSNGNSDADGDADSDGGDFLVWARSIGDVTSPLPSLLSEGFLTGTSVFENNSSISLGNAFHVGANQDLALKIRLSDGTILDADVQYIPGPAASKSIPEPSGSIIFLLATFQIGINGTRGWYRG